MSKWKYLMYFVLLSGFLSVLPSAMAMPSPQTGGISTTYPPTAASIIMTGVWGSDKWPINEYVFYGPYNATCGFFSFSIVNMSNGVIITGAEAILELSSRLIVNSTGPSLLWIGTHLEPNATFLASAGMGSVALLRLGGTSDVPHTIVSEGSVNITGAMLNYWILNTTQGSDQVSMWVEKTTGMTLRLQWTNSGNNNIDIIVTSATNITADKGGTEQSGIAGYDIFLLAASASIVIFLLGKKVRARPRV